MTKTINFDELFMELRKMHHKAVEIKEVQEAIMAHQILENYDVVKKSDMEQLKLDFRNLIENYWHAIRMRGVDFRPGEQFEEERYARDLMVKYIDI